MKVYIVYIENGDNYQNGYIKIQGIFLEEQKALDYKKENDYTEIEEYEVIE